MAEPGFIRQCSDPMTDAERHSWIEQCVKEATGLDVVLCRVTAHPEISDLILFEGWKEQPEDQGEPRFQLKSEGQC